MKKIIFFLGIIYVLFPGRELYSFELVVVEGTNDIIFSLDNELRFLTVNSAIKSHLLIPPESVIAKKFIDLVFEGHDNRAIGKQYLLLQLDVFLKDKKPVTFQTEFKLPISSESKEMKVRLEYITIKGKNEILGQASGVTEDTFLECFISENQKIQVGNKLYTVEGLTYRLTRNLKKYLVPKEVNLVRLALREVIINAIEHGNLHISYEKKTEALLNDNYFDLIAERQYDPECKEKLVEIEFMITENEVTYIIKDEGDGFDHEKVLQKEISNADKKIPHGRGILLAKDVFDEINYNEKGNRVVLVKKIP
ncbi:MAG: hypothetical protein GY754_23020 [bacterium]|nr:hypothetical protein [bacterium]